MKKYFLKKKKRDNSLFSRTKKNIVVCNEKDQEWFSMSEEINSVVLDIKNLENQMKKEIEVIKPVFVSITEDTDELLGVISSFMCGCTLILVEPQVSEKTSQIEVDSNLSIVVVISPKSKNLKGTKKLLKRLNANTYIKYSEEKITRESTYQEIQKLIMDLDSEGKPSKNIPNLSEFFTYDKLLKEYETLKKNEKQAEKNIKALIAFYNR